MADFWKSKQEFFRDFEKAHGKAHGDKVGGEDASAETLRAKKIESYLRDIQNMSRKDNELTAKFMESWEKSKEKRTVDEEKAQKDRLAAQAENRVFNGNLREYFKYSTKEMRDNFKSGFEVNALTFGKGLTKLASGLGFLGKFSPEPLLKFFDNYREFTKKRTEEQRQVKMLDALYDLRYVQGKSAGFIEVYLKKQGMSDDRIWDIMRKLEELEKERFVWEKSKEEKPNEGEQTILKPGTPAGDAFDKAKRYNPNEPKQIDWAKVAKEEKAGLEGKTDDAILQETYIELVNQGKQLDAILLASQEFNKMFGEWTDEWNDENKRKAELLASKKDEEGGGSWFDVLGGNLATKLASAIATWLGGLGLTSIAITGAIGLAIGASLMGIAKVVSDWLKSKKTPEELAKDDKQVAESKALSSDMGNLGEGLEGGMGGPIHLGDEWEQKRAEEYKKAGIGKKEVSLGGKGVDTEREIKKAEKEKARARAKEAEEKAKKDKKASEVPALDAVTGQPITGKVEIHNHLNKDKMSQLAGRDLANLATG